MKKVLIVVCLFFAIPFFLLPIVRATRNTIRTQAGMPTVEEEIRQQAQEEPPQPVADPIIQHQREEVLKKYQAEQILQKIEAPGKLSRMYVLPRFHRLTFEDKEALASVAIAYAYMVPKGGTISRRTIMPVYDARTNKQIGIISNAGLQLD